MARVAQVFCGLVLLAGCAVGPDFRRPDAPPVQAFTPGQPPATTVVADGQAQTFAYGKQLRADWWKLVGSTKLDALVAGAVAHNPSVAAADATLAQSEALLHAGYGIFFPQAAASASATQQQASPQRLGQAGPTSIFSLFTLSASISYTLDLFGTQRRIEKLQAQVDGPRFALLAAQLTVTANVVNTAIARASYLAQLAATAELLTLEREQLKIAEAQAQAGTQPYANVLALQSQIASTEAALPPLAQTADHAAHLLAVLQGLTPAEAPALPLALGDLTLPAELPVSLPSELVAQRPDIRMAEAVLHATSANIGIATAALIPSLTLNAGYGVNNTSLGNLFNASSNFWNVGAGITTPLFDGGTLWYQRKAAIEAYRQSAAAYRETVLAAFAQVADVLRALEHDAQALDAQLRAVDAAAEALRLIQVNYKSGLADYLQVLTADKQLQQARIAAIQARGQRLQDTVALYAALGGGWWNAAAAK